MYLAYSCLLIQKACYLLGQITGRLQESHESALSISFKRTPCSIGSGALHMSSLAALQGRKLVEIYPNIQCSVEMYTVYILWFVCIFLHFILSLWKSQACWVCVGGTFCVEMWGACGLFWHEWALSCLGTPGVTPQQVHLWLPCWTWHPSSIGPLFGESPVNWPM